MSEGPIALPELLMPPQLVGLEVLREKLEINDLKISPNTQEKEKDLVKISIDFYEDNLDFMLACKESNTELALYILEINNPEIMKKKLAVADENGNTALSWSIINVMYDLFTTIMILSSEKDIIRQNNDGYTPLMLACSKTNDQSLQTVHNNFFKIEMAKTIFGFSTNDALINKYGETALIIACKNNLLDIATSLVQSDVPANCNADQIDNTGMSALNWACFYSWDFMCIELMKRMKTPQRYKDNIMTPLITSCRRSSKIIEQILLFDKNNIDNIDAEGNTALIWACCRNLPKSAETIIDYAKNNNSQKNKYGGTALMWAIRNKMNNVINKLLPSVKNLDTYRTCDNESYMLLLVINGYNQLAHSILRLTSTKTLNDADINQQTILNAACVRNESAELVETLINTGGIKFNCVDDAGNTPLMNLLMHGYDNLAVTLIKKSYAVTNSFGNCGINNVNKLGKNALMLSCMHRSRRTVRYMLTSISSLTLDHISPDNKTAFSLACSCGLKDVALMIINAGKNNKLNPEYFECVDNNGQTPLIALVRTGWSVMDDEDNGKTEYTKILTYLLTGPHKDNIKIKHADKYGNTALIYACQRGDTASALDIYNTLKSNPEQSNVFNETALFHAITNGLVEMAEKLAQDSTSQPNLITKMTNNVARDMDTALEYYGFGRYQHTTALILAIQNKMTNTINLLLNRPDCAINYVNKDGVSAFTQSLSNDMNFQIQNDTTKKIINHPNFKINESVIMKLYDSNLIELMKSAIEKSPDIDLKNIIALACDKNDGPTIRWFLENNKDIESPCTPSTPDQLEDQLIKKDSKKSKYRDQILRPIIENFLGISIDKYDVVSDILKTTDKADIRQLVESIENTKNKCLICHKQNYTDYMFEPCAHVVKIDDECLKEIKTCPMCRNNFENVKRAYVSY
jgi:ankyrin repeat protein